MNELVTLQPARPHDALAIARMSRVLVEHGLDWTWTPERVAAHIRHRDSVVLLARTHTRRAGFAIMQFDEDDAHLNLFAVTPNLRRLGIGRRMLTWLHQSAVTAGTFIVRLEVRAGNTDAQRFYGKLGYRACGRLAGYYQRREDAIRMVCDLSVAGRGPDRLRDQDP